MDRLIYVLGLTAALTLYGSEGDVAAAASSSTAPVQQQVQPKAQPKQVQPAPQKYSGEGTDDDYYDDDDDDAILMEEEDSPPSDQDDDQKDDDQDQ